MSTIPELPKQITSLPDIPGASSGRGQNPVSRLWCSKCTVISSNCLERFSWTWILGVSLFRTHIDSQAVWWKLFKIKLCSGCLLHHGFWSHSQLWESLQKTSLQNLSVVRHHCSGGELSRWSTATGPTQSNIRHTKYLSCSFVLCPSRSVFLPGFWNWVDWRALVQH